MRPHKKPLNPHFSSGPTSKFPGWSLDAIDTTSLSRSHRAPQPKSRLKRVIEESKRLLGIPADYLVGIVPASDTGAMEMAMWSLLGQRGVDVLAWESFGTGWVSDLRNQLRLDDVRAFTAGYGDLPDLSSVDPERDVVFTWNGTTSGVVVPDATWISDEREGVVICDATSAAFAISIEWDKLDVVTWSWQKALGGEAGHGMLALSPRAVERLASHTPPWPLPKIFRLTKGDKLISDLFEGATINTPSMLAVEDHLAGLAWAEQIGGLAELIARSQRNLTTITDWVTATPWVAFLASRPEQRSSTSICLSIIEPWFTDLPEAGQRQLIKQIASRLEDEGVALDIAGYRDAPPGLRIWGGSTVEATDIAQLLPWLDWAFANLER
jgi:phosphoserine aminotransferase